MSLEAQFVMACAGRERNVSLSIRDEVVVLVGANGSGKTHLLEHLAGLRDPQTGWMTLRERTLFSATEGPVVPVEDRRVAYVPQDSGLFPHMSILENVAFALRCAKPRLGSSERDKGALELLARMDVAHLATRRARHLSGGERQRVALARALAIDPDLWLLDEPLSALDVGARIRVATQLRAHLRERKVPAVVVTHDPQEARRLGDRLLVLEDDGLVEEPAFVDLRCGFRTMQGSRFLGEMHGSPASATHPKKGFG